MDGCRVVCMALDGSRMQVRETNTTLPCRLSLLSRSTKKRQRRLGAVLVGDELSPKLQDGSVDEVACVRERRLHFASCRTLNTDRLARSPWNIVS